MKESRRTRRIVVGALFGAHLALYLVSWLLGAVDPLEFFRGLRAGHVDEREFFHLLLLAGNALIGFVLIRGEHDLLLGGGTMFLCGAHAFVHHLLTPDALTSGALLMVSVIVLYVGVKINTELPTRYWWTFVASYFALFFIFVQIRWSAFVPGLEVKTGMANAAPLFLLFLLGLAACARSFKLLAYFWAFAISFTFCQPYAWQALLIAFFVLGAVFSARARVPSPTAVVFLSCGLILTLLVLFPVVATLTGEPVFNIEKAFDNPDFSKALGRTLLTATISTLILVVFTVPLAYAISRLRFRGRTLLLSLIDVPIVVPQSVAGIMLVMLFGENQYLGGLAEHYFNIRFGGALAGVCLAQVFVAMPFMARSAIAAFDAVPESLELAARTLGASSWSAFRRVALPLASRGIFLGAVLAWARAAGEFGALVFIAASPKTAPTFIHDSFNTKGLVQTVPMVAALLLFSLVMFFLLQFVSRTLPSAHGEREAQQ